MNPLESNLILPLKCVIRGMSTADSVMSVGVPLRGIPGSEPETSAGAVLRTILNQLHCHPKPVTLGF